MQSGEHAQAGAVYMTHLSQFEHDVTALAQRFLHHLPQPGRLVPRHDPAAAHLNTAPGHVARAHFKGHVAFLSSPQTITPGRARCKQVPEAAGFCPGCKAICYRISFASLAPTASLLPSDCRINLALRIVFTIESKLSGERG